MCNSKKHDFVQIHCHDSMSNLDGCAKVENIIKRAKEFGHKALATTNHGSPGILYSFAKECKKNNIKPILGLEFYITNDLQSRVSNKGREFDDKDYHQSIYIKDKEGYKNFNYLTYVSFTDGYYYKPRIDFDLLFSKSKGLMATSSCIASKFNQLITVGRIKEAEELFLKFRNHFGDDFYGEIQFNELNDKSVYGIDQRSNNQVIIDLCNRYDVPIMIGGDVHYLDKGDAELQDAVINSKRQAKEGEEGFKIHARHLYFHDTSDYYDFNKKFDYNYDEKFLEQCFENSVKFSEKVNFEFETGKQHVPKIKIGNTDPKDFIEEKTWEGLVKRIEVDRKYFPDSYSNEDIEKLEKQTEYELKVINDLGLNDYMLVVYDIIKWCKENNVYVGPGRGCFLPGSMVNLSNGLKVRIEDIKNGDKIANYFSKIGNVINTFIYDINEEMVELEFENGKKISCTKDHEIYTENRDWVKADELTKEDNIQEINFNYISLINKKYFDYKGKVYDLEIESENNDHSYNIENIVVHNSAAASVVAYALGITDLNPLKHNLIFERFINPNRKVMADIDVDFMLGGRDKVLEYLIQTYGREAVCNVATYGTYGPKSALSDMSRGLYKDTGHDTVLMRKITKLPEIDDADGGKNANGGINPTLIEYFDRINKLNHDDEVSNWINGNQDTIKFAEKLIGQMKSIGTHAGGIVVTPGPVYDYIPVMKGGGNLVTAFREADGSSKDLGELGILKLDILGLKTLNILKECVDNIKKDKGIDLEEKIYHLDLTDKKLIKYFSTGNNYGIFQMDRSAMFTSKFKQDGGEVDSFEDIIAINAMNRPGPLEKFLPKYGYWKAIDKGKIKLTDEELAIVDKERYPFEFMRKILSPTYGACLYQEQVMQLVCELTGITFGESDSFRRAIAWKADNPKFYTVKSYFDNVENSMLNKGYTKEDVEYFLKYLRDNSGYSFNIAHCLTKNHLVDSKNRGKINLLDVEIGEEILANNPETKIDEFVKVKKIHKNGKKEMYKIKTQSGLIIECTMEHKILCEDGKKYPLKEIIKNNLKIKTK